jgi:hypothetical protein
MVTSVKSNSPSVQPASPSTSGPASQESGSRSGSPIQSTSPRSESPTGLQSRQQAQSLAGGGPASPLAGGGPASSLAGGGPASSLAGGGPASSLAGGGPASPLASGGSTENQGIRQDQANHPKSLAGGGSASLLAGGGPASPLAGGGPTENQGIQQGQANQPNNVLTDPEETMRSAVRMSNQHPHNRDLQTEAHRASLNYKQRSTTNADIAAIGNQAVTTAASSLAELGSRGVVNSLTDSATNVATAIPYAAATGSAVLKHGVGSLALAAGTQLNQNKVTPLLDRYTGTRHVPTPVTTILPENHKDALDLLKADYGSNMEIEIYNKQKRAGTLNPAVSALVYGAGEFGATVAQSFVPNLGAKAAVAAGGPTVGGAILGGIVGHQKATATYNAPTVQGITDLVDRHANRPYDSEAMNAQLRDIEKQPHNLYYTENPSAAIKAHDFEERAANRPSTATGIAHSYGNRALDLERDLRVADGLQAAGSIGAAAINTASPLVGALIAGASSGVGIGTAIQQQGLLETIREHPAYDRAIAADERLNAAAQDPAADDLAEQGNAPL